MGRILVVDDDESVRKMVRFRLSGTHEVVDTASPEEALALALQHKPDAILLDLQMPQYSGFELCQTFSGLSFTQLIPIFIISGESAANTKDFCRSLGAKGYFQKPIDFDALESQIARVMSAQKQERRSEVRVRLRAPIVLRGVDASGKEFDLLTHTDNVSKSGFLCTCPHKLDTDSLVKVFLVNEARDYAGLAHAIRVEWEGTPGQRYAFRFTEKSGSWLLQ